MLDARGRCGAQQWKREGGFCVRRKRRATRARERAATAAAARRRLQRARAPRPPIRKRRNTPTRRQHNTTPTGKQSQHRKLSLRPHTHLRAHPISRFKEKSKEERGAKSCPLAPTPSPPTPRPRAQQQQQQQQQQPWRRSREARTTTTASRWAGAEAWCVLHRFLSSSPPLNFARRLLDPRRPGEAKAVSLSRARLLRLVPRAQPRVPNARAHKRWRF
jgi:hypothetical protein